MGDSINKCIEVDDILAGFADIQLQKRLPSYIETFLPELPKDAMFVHQSSNASASNSGTSQSQLVNPVMNNDSSPDLDVTGSPLNFTKYSVCVDDSVLEIKKCWSSDEEKHLPVALRNARYKDGLQLYENKLSIISRYLMEVQNCHIPLWIVCDGLDISRTLLLSAFKVGGWCSRSSVQYKGLFSLSCIDELDDIFSLSSTNEQGNVDVHCVFDLYDNGLEKTLDITQNEFVSRNCPKMLVKLQWHHASLKVPPGGVSANLAVDLNIGHKSSSIFALWSQLNSLSTYYGMLYSIINDKQFPMLSNNLCDEILLQKLSTKIVALINSPENTVGSLSQISCSSVLLHEKSRENILTVLTKQVVGCMRLECDVTDKIWLLLNELNDIRYITTCLNKVFSELGECKSKAQTSLRKKTLLTNIIGAVLNGNLAVTELSVEKTLEVMIETGVEKLKQDYIYVLKKLGVECSNFFTNSTASISKRLDIVKHDMNVLAQMHVALDFILGIQFRFNMTEQNLNALAKSVFQKSCEIITSLNILQKNTLISLQVPVMFESIVDHLPSNYSNLKLVASSKDGEVRDYSVLLLTSQPVFPPSLMQWNNEKQEEAENTFIEPQYHIYKLSCYCDYIGREWM